VWVVNVFEVHQGGKGADEGGGAERAGGEGGVEVGPGVRQSPRGQVSGYIASCC